MYNDTEIIQKAASNEPRLNYFVGRILFSSCQRTELVINHETDENSQ